MFEQGRWAEMIEWCQKQVVMNKVEPTFYPGWNQYPVYRCGNTDDWLEVTTWMRKNHCDHFLLSSGSYGYVFQVRANHEWFLLRWS